MSGPQQDSKSGHVRELNSRKRIDAGDLVDAVQLVFMRLKEDSSLDETDSYACDWIGVPDDNNIQTISGKGSPVVGLHGRGAAVLDAIGLVFGKLSP